MDVAQFRELLANRTAAGVHELLQCSPPLAALWEDGQGHWDRAHEIAQADASADGSRIHAYLHRKEGDLGNADYWYGRAGCTRPNVSLDEEWTALVTEYLRRADTA